MSLSALELEISRCQRCANILCGYGIEPRPVFHGATGAPVFLIGQAPGKTEYVLRRPFQGGAGKAIKSLFIACGLRDFDRLVYQTSVTKCFPGRREGSSSDRLPSVREVHNCLPFLLRQLDIVRPRLIVCLGLLSWKAFLSMCEADQPGYCEREIGINNPNEAKIPHLVGRLLAWRGSLVIPMIHPAGSANGARSRYPEHDRKSKELLQASFTSIGVNDL
jgi:uracil-DNA glycosylase family 4